MKLLTERELKELPQGSKVFIKYEHPEDQGYEGFATVEHLPDVAVLRIGILRLEYEYFSDDDQQADNEGRDGDRLRVYAVKCEVT